MKIAGFRVTNYRSVIDSGWVEIDDLTVLVGKNESGKTALLRALHKFKPFQSDPYNIDREWPRGRRLSRNAKAAVCSVGFTLNDEEKAELKASVDEAVYLNAPIVLTRCYDGTYSLEPSLERFPRRPPKIKILDELVALVAFSSPHPAAISPNISRCSDQVSQHLFAGRFDALTKNPDSLRQLLLSSIHRKPDAEESEFVEAYIAKVQGIATSLRDAATVESIVQEFVIKHIPVFIYMDDFRTFRGTARIDQVKQRNDSNTLTDEDKTLITILKLSGLDLDSEFAKGKSEDPSVKEQRQYDLNDAGLSLTTDISSRWKQRKYEVQFRADQFSFFTMVKDETGPHLIPLEDRSKGFQWFFSFDLMFMYESQGSFKGCVILLDEPGLHLHANAQRDLVARLEAYAVSNALIYTTHLPFMIDLRTPGRIRTISESKDGTVVDKFFNLSQPDAKLTLQSALGMSGSTSYLVAQRNLVVEGVDDFMILSELSNLLIRSGQAGLPEDVHITAAGGASEAAYIATFMIGQKLDVVALFDSDSAGAEAADKLLKSWLTRYGQGTAQIVRIADALEAKAERAIEDLFPDDYYLDKVHEVYSRQLKTAGIARLPLVGKDQLVKRVERAMETAGISFNKGSVAKAIRSELSKMSNFDRLPAETIEKAKKLIAAVAAAFTAKK